jgi:hypothetical protein
MFIWSRDGNTFLQGRRLVTPDVDTDEYGALVEWYWQGKPKYLEKNLSQCHFMQHRSHIDLGSNPDHRGKKLTTKWLSHGTARFKDESNLCYT